ncbi:unnamed protein product [Phytophthora fragariaefolia]|uniref:Unnamed protein product n=1 Tax=Phytophthora fragariaefolia TaxID=1490495 RepID=A0A9W6XK67_9STRA|nr:unnamed protein product [Phytophthora fragariaefolia]
MEAKAGMDERFYTPRSSARRGYSSASSEDERFVSPRESARSVSSDDNEYVTPREIAPAVAHAPRSASTSAAALSSTAVYKDAAFRASSKHLPVAERVYDVLDYKQCRSGSVSELRGAAPPADDYDLFSAARHNRYESVVYMLDQGVPVNSRDAFGNTLLSIACQNGLKRVAKLALRRGANINSQNVTLHFCFAYGYGDSLGAYLISKGADTTIENDDGVVCYYGVSQTLARK